jgi:hypothetical protein
MSLEWARARARENEARLRKSAGREDRARVVEHAIGPLRVVLASTPGAPADTGACLASTRLGVPPSTRFTPEGRASRAAGSVAAAVLAAHAGSEELQERINRQSD